METSFLRDAIDRITDLARPFTMEADGHKFCSKALLEVKAEEFSPTVYEVDTLDALVKLILTEGLTLGRMLYVRVDSARKVTVATTYNGGELRNPYERFPLYEAKLYDHVRDEDGTVPVEAVATEIYDIFQNGRQAKNS